MWARYAEWGVVSVLHGSLSWGLSFPPCALLLRVRSSSGALEWPFCLEVYVLTYLLNVRLVGKFSNDLGCGDSLSRDALFVY
jgi:hypothetical protein